MSLTNFKNESNEIILKLNDVEKRLSEIDDEIKRIDFKNNVFIYYILDKRIKK